MAPVGHTCEQSLHSGRQYPRSYDISGCIRFIRLVEGRNTWLEQADTHNWQAVQCAAMFRALNEPGGVMGVWRFGIFLSSMAASKRARLTSTSCIVLFNFSCAFRADAVAAIAVTVRKLRRASLTSLDEAA